jgi:hypothetical protein
MVYIFGMCEDCGKQIKDCKCNWEEEDDANMEE